MADPESRETDEKHRKDDPPEPLTLSDPEPLAAGPAEAERPPLADTPETAPDTMAGPVVEPRDDEPVLPPRDEAPVMAPAAPPRRSGPPGFLLLLLGGIAGAAGGFAYSRHAQPDWPLADYGLTRQSAALQAEVTTLRAELAAKPAPQPAAPAPAAPAELKQAEDRAAAAEAKVAELEAKLAEAPAPMPASVPESVGTLEAEIAALRAQIAEASGSAVSAAEAEAAERVAAVQEEAEKLKAEVEAAARAETTAAALGQVRASIDGGTPYAPALEELAEKGVEVPASLISTAQGGVPTLPALEDSFPDAARQALAASRKATMGEDWMSRTRAFLMTEAGIRSLKPREGTDPDAILSRAEAAVRDGDLAGALAEIGTLPAEGQEAMAGWAAEAKKRIDAVEAVAALAASAEGK